MVISNGAMSQCFLKRIFILHLVGVLLERLPVAGDEPSLLKRQISEAAERCDTVVTSGGVPVGAYNLHQSPRCGNSQRKSLLTRGAASRQAPVFASETERSGPPVIRFFGFSDA